MSERYRSGAAQDAAKIRAEFKKLGWGRNHVSVTCSNYSMGSSVSVYIKSPEVGHRKAEEIACGIAEHIDRDQWGDILNGGNRYVHVSHTSECRAIMARRYWDALADAVGRLDPERRTSLERVTDSVNVGQDGAGWLQLWVNGRVGLSFPNDLDSEHQSGFTNGAFCVALEMIAA
ncbi:MAG: hypothetical protein KAI97_09785 [Gemmatimonadetes bacterium]|nr:hypothetical protein [Gemmatimonadota bacterium]